VRSWYVTEVWLFPVTALRRFLVVTTCAGFGVESRGGAPIPDRVGRGDDVGYGPKEVLAADD
jgi:hypothetical protein